MTFQPPPPPPPPPSSPPPPPPGDWGPPPGQGPSGPSGFNAANVDRLDWGILGAGLLAFIFSFTSYYSFSATHCGSLCISVDENAWHGFFGWFAMLAAVIGAVAVGLQLFMPHIKFPLPNRAISVIGFGVASLCVILALFIEPGYLGYDGPGIDKGHGYGYWISLVVILAGLVLSLMRAQQTNTALPGPLNKMPKIGN